MDGDEGAHWASHQGRYDTMSAAFTPHLFGAAAIRTTDQVLDVGCGCGLSTRQAARTVSNGRAVGIDLSAPMLERARATAVVEGITNVIFEQGDAQVHPLPAGAFDVAISRFGIMFFADPVAAFANICRSLSPGGRLAALCWQEIANNPWLMVPATAALAHVPVPDLGAPGTPGPFSLADPDHITALLTAAGLHQVSTTDVVAPLLLGRDTADTVEFIAGTGMARGLLDGADPDAAARALDAVADALRPYETPAGVQLDGAAWVVTATRP